VVTDVALLVRRVLKALVGPAVRPVQVAREMVAAHPKVALVVLFALVVVAVAALRGNRVAALALIPLSLAWLVLNQPFEGPTLLVLTSSHGVTLSDLIAVGGLGIAGWQLASAAL